MSFTHYDLGTIEKGNIVEILLEGNAANVQLMDNINFQHYKNGRRCQYFGGHVTTSVTQLPVPSKGRWHVAIDMGGHQGSVKSSVRVI